MTVIDRPFDEGFFRVQVENIEFVDPWRADQKRALQHLLCRWLVLDDFCDFAAGNYLARRGCHILAERKFRQVGLTQTQIAAAGDNIFGEHLHATNQIFAVAGDGFLVELRIGQQEIAWRCRRRDLLDIEGGLVPRVIVEPFGVLDQIAGPARRNEISLLEKIEKGVLAPILVGRSACHPFRALTTSSTSSPLMRRMEFDQMAM